ncbi:hypothetical protein H8356DRAFT_1286690 [Neocallimastix lanati (nom. inval.)]|nr:hypothetical protein H8356DRAFT_1286690 [Neocallimastix sp. JGI-2020a]
MKFHKNIYVPEINSFYTTSLSILNNKEQATYELLFEELKKECKALEVQKNKLCYNEVESNHKIYLFYKAITNFPFINPEYIFDIYNYIKNYMSNI